MVLIALDGIYGVVLWQTPPGDHDIAKWRQFLRGSKLLSRLEEESLVKAEIQQDTAWYKRNLSAVFCPLKEYTAAIEEGTESSC